MSNAVATLQPTRLAIPGEVAKKFELSQTQWRVLVDQIFPAAKTVEAVVMALEYCRARSLDIYKRPVHIVPVYSSAKKQMVESVWPGIAEIRTTAARTGEYAGIDAVEFGPMVERTFTGQTGGHNTDTISKKVSFPEWASVIVYRIVQGQKCAFHTKIFWEETYASIGKSGVPNEMWTKRPRGQIDKCVEAAALRKAFPEEVGSMYAAEEMEGRVIDDAAEVATTPKPPRPDTAKPTSAPPKPNGSAQPAGEPAKQQPPKPANDQQSELAGKDVEEAVIDDEIPNFDQETGEVIDEGNGDVDEGEDLTPSDMLTLLDDAMATKITEADILDLWNEHDLPARLTHVEKGAEFISIATAVRNKHLKRVRAK